MARQHRQIGERAGGRKSHSQCGSERQLRRHGRLLASSGLSGETRRRSGIRRNRRPRTRGPFAGRDAVRAGRCNAARNPFRQRCSAAGGDNTGDGRLADGSARAAFRCRYGSRRIVARRDRREETIFRRTGGGAFAIFLAEGRRRGRASHWTVWRTEPAATAEEYWTETRPTAKGKTENATSGVVRGPPRTGLPPTGRLLVLGGRLVVRREPSPARPGEAEGGTAQEGRRRMASAIARRPARSTLPGRRGGGTFTVRGRTADLQDAQGLARRGPCLS